MSSQNRSVHHSFGLKEQYYDALQESNQGELTIHLPEELLFTEHTFPRKDTTVCDFFHTNAPPTTADTTTAITTTTNTTHRPDIHSNITHTMHNKTITTLNQIDPSIVLNQTNHQATTTNPILELLVKIEFILSNPSTGIYFVQPDFDVARNVRDAFDIYLFELSQDVSSIIFCQSIKIEPSLVSLFGRL